MAEHDFYEGMTVSMASIEGLPPGTAARLESIGLLDAQQFVDAVADPATAARLAEYLEVTQGQLRRRFRPRSTMPPCSASHATRARAAPASPLP